MNFANLKKVLILSSALLAFSNVSNATTEGIKTTINYSSNAISNIDYNVYSTVLNSVKQGISKYFKIYWQ